MPKVFWVSRDKRGGCYPDEILCGTKRPRLEGLDYETKELDRIFFLTLGEAKIMGLSLKPGEAKRVKLVEVKK